MGRVDSLARRGPRKVPIRQPKHEFANHIGVSTGLDGVGRVELLLTVWEKNRVGKATHLVLGHILFYVVRDQMLIAAHVLWR